MTSIASGDPHFIFRTRDQIVDHLLAVILANTKKQVGVELEAFVVDQNSNPISRKTGQRLFYQLAEHFQNQGYSVNITTERIGPLAGEAATKLSIDNVGAVTIEPGYQFELITLPSEQPEDVVKNLQLLRAALIQCSQEIGHTTLFEGYSESFADLTPGGIRARDIQWSDYYKTFPDGPQQTLRRGQYGTASTQITLDSGGDKFNEYWSAALLVEPALAIGLRQKPDRLNIIKEGYGKIIPGQVDPITAAWKAESPRRTLEFIVDRFLDLHVPFVPNNNGILVPQPLDMDGQPPTVFDLMQEGRLTGLALNNIGGFLYSAPALRNVVYGLMEIRSMDSFPADSDGSEIKISAALALTRNLIYNDKNRRALLDRFAHFSAAEIEFFHRCPAMPNRMTALKAHIGHNGGSMLIKDVVREIISMGTDDTVSAAMGQNGHARYNGQALRSRPQGSEAHAAQRWNDALHVQPPFLPSHPTTRFHRAPYALVA